MQNNVILAGNIGQNPEVRTTLRDHRREGRFPEPPEVGRKRKPRAGRPRRRDPVLKNGVFPSARRGNRPGWSFSAQSCLSGQSEAFRNFLGSGLSPAPQAERSVYAARCRADPKILPVIVEALGRCATGTARAIFATSLCRPPAFRIETQRCRVALLDQSKGGI